MSSVSLNSCESSPGPWPEHIFARPGGQGGGDDKTPDGGCRLQDSRRLCRWPRRSAGDQHPKSAGQTETNHRPAGQSRKYLLRLNGTIGEGGTRQTIDKARLVLPPPGHQGKNTFLILLYFFLRKSHPRKRSRTPLPQDGKPIPDRTVPLPFSGLSGLQIDVAIRSLLTQFYRLL